MCCQACSYSIHAASSIVPNFLSVVYLLLLSNCRLHLMIVYQNACASHWTWSWHLSTGCGGQSTSTFWGVWYFMVGDCLEVLIGPLHTFVSILWACTSLILVFNISMTLSCTKTRVPLHKRTFGDASMACFLTYRDYPADLLRSMWSTPIFFQRSQVPPLVKVAGQLAQ